MDCHATNVARNDRGDTSHTRTGHKSRTSIGNNSCTSTLSFETKRSRFIMSAGDARSAFLFTGLLRFARNDKRRCRASSLAMTRIGCELHTDLSSRGSVTTVAIQLL